jgi:hypothetical protein
MTNLNLPIITSVMMGIFIIVQCNSPEPTSSTPVEESFGGFESQVAWGEHLVTIGACHDCHTPKKMTPMGPDIDSSLMFAGHIAGSPEPEVDIKEIQQKGLVVTNDLTTWIGPWGISYTANLTSDPTGIGTWREEQFILAIREGKFKGLAEARSLLPPMPWQMYRHFTDEELKAIFSYLKSTKPIQNVVPQPVPPVSM